LKSADGQPPSDFPRWGKPTEHSACFSNVPDVIGVFENVEQRYKDDVVVIQMIKYIQHRFFLLGEGEGG